MLEDVESGNNKSNPKIKHKKLSEREIQLRKQKFKLHEDSDKAYLTRREGECMAFMLHGKRNCEVAKELNLSVKTNEYYIEKMKKRLGVKSKEALLDMIHKSDFPKLKDELINEVRTGCYK